MTAVVLGGWVRSTELREEGRGYTAAVALLSHKNSSSFSARKKERKEE